MSRENWGEQEGCAHQWLLIWSILKESIMKQMKELGGIFSCVQGLGSYLPRITGLKKCLLLVAYISWVYCFTKESVLHRKGTCVNMSETVQFLWAWEIGSGDKVRLPLKKTKQLIVIGTESKVQKYNKLMNINKEKPGTRMLIWRRLSKDWVDL